MKIKRKNWDTDNQCILTYSPGSGPINAWLMKLREICQDNLLSLVSETGQPDPEDLKQSIKKELPLPGTSFFDAFVEFMKENHNEWARGTYFVLYALPE